MAGSLAKQPTHSPARADRSANCVGWRRSKSVCRTCYIHPGVIEASLELSLLDPIELRDDALAEADGLRPEEQAVLRFLRKRLAKEQAA